MSCCESEGVRVQYLYNINVEMNVYIDNSNIFNHSH